MTFSTIISNIYFHLASTSDMENWELHLESLNLSPLRGNLTSSFAEATRQRRAYEAWLFKMIDESDEDDDCQFLLSEIERLQSPGEERDINRWITRGKIGDVEYGIIEEDPTWSDTGWANLPDSPWNETPDCSLQDSGVEVIPSDTSCWMKGGPNLSWVKEYSFDNKPEAQKFVNKIRSSFRKGDHDKEVIRTEVRQNPKLTYVAVLLESDGNWGTWDVPGHRKQLSEYRDSQVEKALERVSRATTRKELDLFSSTAKRYSRDQMTLNSGKTKDSSGKPVRSNGLDYKRFATIMNAISSRAKELSLPGFRTYKIKEFLNNRKPVNGDLFDHGCRDGEFKALDQEEIINFDFESDDSPWIPSKECHQRLVRSGPTGFVPKTWNQLLSENKEWKSFKISKLAA